MIRAFLLTLATMLAALACATAYAETKAPKSPFAIPKAARPAQPTVTRDPPTMVQRAWYWILGQQQKVNRQLADAIKTMKSGRYVEGTLVLAFLSFVYGLLHAAGPGHGKGVISSYVVANERTVRRGIMLSFLAAFIQALSAIVIVGALAVVLNATSLQIRATEAWIETLSWGFVALVGLWLLVSQVRKILARRAVRDAHRQAVAASHSTQDGGHGHSHDHGHHHHDHDGDCAHGDAFNPDHDHSNCNHAHMPDPRELDGDLSWKKAFAIAFSVGIRPCSGAIIVMIFALSQGLLLAGVFATFAMALGTAIAVSILASLALGSRDLAEKLAGGSGSVLGRGVVTVAGLVGAALVFVLGASLFVASLNGTGPL